MGRKAGATRIKRSRAPPFWKVPRKKLRFVYRVRPGPHPKDRAYPIAVLIRDVLKLVETAREAEWVIKEGRIKVDGVVRRDPGFPVGLMDIVSVEALNANYRLLPDIRGGLQPIPIPAEEARIKPLAVKSKKTVKQGQIQLGLHDGRTLLLQPGQLEVHVGDTLLYNLSTKRVSRVLPLKEGSLVLLTKGRFGGALARIARVNPGSITSPATVELELDSERVIVPKDSVFVIGDGGPAITIGGTGKPPS